jgi:hypothetical protein
MVLRYLIDATALHHSTVSTGLTPLWFSSSLLDLLVS